MNTREKFIETAHFNKSSNTLKWEFGYWGATIERWYNEGLPKINYPTIPTNIINTTASLYTTVWSYFLKREKNLFEKVYKQQDTKLKLPAGMPVCAGGLYWPTQGFVMDTDVRDYFEMDKMQTIVCVEQLFYPQFEPKILKEDERYIDYLDLDGCIRRFSKSEQVLPAGLEWPIKDWGTWEQIKEERMSLENIKGRLPDNWSDLRNTIIETTL